MGVLFGEDKHFNQLQESDLSTNDICVCAICIHITNTYTCL